MVCNWVAGALPYILALGRTPNYSRYDLGLPLDEFKEVIDLMVENGDYARLEPYPGLHIVRDWEVTFLTRRRPGFKTHLMYSLQAQTRLWLKSQGLKGDVVFTQDKAAWCRQFLPDFMVEDYKQDQEKIAEVVPCYLLDRPWNQGGDRYRILHLGEIYD